MAMSEWVHVTIPCPHRDAEGRECGEEATVWFETDGDRSDAVGPSADAEEACPRGHDLDNLPSDQLAVYHARAWSALSESCATRPERLHA
jgi:hypothetical protein